MAADKKKLYDESSKASEKDSDRNSTIVYEYNIFSKKHEKSKPIQDQDEDTTLLDLKKHANLSDKVSDEEIFNWKSSRLVNKSKTDFDENSSKLKAKFPPKRQGIFTPLEDDEEVNDTSRLRSKLNPYTTHYLADKLTFLISDRVTKKQLSRHAYLLDEFVKASAEGFFLTDLRAINLIFDFLLENIETNEYREKLITLLEIAAYPILMEKMSDLTKCLSDFEHYFTTLGHMLVMINEDLASDLVFRALFNSLRKDGSFRPQNAVKVEYCHAAVINSSLIETIAHMLLFGRSALFRKYVDLGIVLACISPIIGNRMISYNSINFLLRRFDPRGPLNNHTTPPPDPVNPNDPNLLVGDSTANFISSTSLILILLKHINEYSTLFNNYPELSKPPSLHELWALRWAFRLECRKFDSKNRRDILASIIGILADCFGSSVLLCEAGIVQDVMSLAVATEFKPRMPEFRWASEVTWDRSNEDCAFKKTLMMCSYIFCLVSPENKEMARHLCFVQGLIFLIDPQLESLRFKWSVPLFEDLRLHALQTLYLFAKLAPSDLYIECNGLTRILWYMEWFTYFPFDQKVVFWCLRLLDASMGKRGSPSRKAFIDNFMELHGVGILMALMYSLLDEEHFPSKINQVALAHCFHVLTSTVGPGRHVNCCGHQLSPLLNLSLSYDALKTLIVCIRKDSYLCDRWIISVLNFVWETVIWNGETRKKLAHEGAMYILLDCLTRVSRPIQSICLGVICDLVLDGECLPHILTWRGGHDRNISLLSLLIKIFQDECEIIGVRLDDDGVISDLENPLMGEYQRQFIFNRTKDNSFTDSSSPAIGEIFGSCRSKVYSLIQLIELFHREKVDIVEEAYKMYRNIQLTCKEQITMRAIDAYLSCKIGEVWVESAVSILEGYDILKNDEQYLDCFVQLARGWAKQLRKEQGEVVSLFKNEHLIQGLTFYGDMKAGFLATSLDALREVRVMARSTDRRRLLDHLEAQKHNSRQLREDQQAEILKDILRTFNPQIDITDLKGLYLSLCASKQFQSVHYGEPETKINWFKGSSDC